MAQSLGFSEKVLSIATQVRAGEGLPTLGLIANAFLLLYSHYLLKVVRETLILTDGSALDKSLATALSALTVGLVVFVYTLFYQKFKDRSRRYWLTFVLNGFFIVNILIFMGLLAIDIQTPMIFYIWQSIYGILLVSHFWSYCADLLNEHSGQRLFPPIMVGATLGAWIGSLSASWVYSQSGVFSVLLAAMICLLVATWLSTLAEQKYPENSKNVRTEQAETGPDYSIVEGFRVVLSQRYLLYIAAFVILMNWINTTGEYIFASYVKDAAGAATAENTGLSKAEVITRYYSTYYTWINSVGFLMQTFLVARLFRWIGIKGSILILPTVMLLGYGLLALVPIFMIARITMVVENSTSYSIANTTRNALYLPLSRNEKYLGKTTIDTFCWRLGDLIQFGVIYMGINWLDWQSLDFIWFNLGLSGLMFWVSLQLSRQFAAQQTHGSG